MPRNDDETLYLPLTTIPLDNPPGSEITGQAAIQFKDEGIALGTPGTVIGVDVTGAGATATRVGDQVTIAVPGGGFSMDVEDEGVSIQVDPSVMNFAGAGVTATALLGEVTVTIPGGSGITELTGDVTAGPGSGAQVATIANDAVTFAKMQAVSANILLGNDAAGTAVEEIACTAAGRAILDDADAAAQRTTLGLGTIATQDANNVSITGGVGTFNADGFRTYDTSGTGFAMKIRNVDTLTADRRLNFTLNDVARNITMSGDVTVSANATISGTNTGDQISIVGITGTKAEFNTAVSDGNITYVGDNVNNLVGGNWKVFYTNGTGVITELELGASGTVLQSNGAASAPTFVTPASGSTDYGKIIPMAMGYGVT